MKDLYGANPEWRKHIFSEEKKEEKKWKSKSKSLNKDMNIICEIFVFQYEYEYILWETFTNIFEYLLHSDTNATKILGPEWCMDVGDNSMFLWLKIVYFLEKIYHLLNFLNFCV